MNEYNDVITEMRIHGVQKAEPRARRILAGLGFTASMARATNDLLLWRLAYANLPSTCSIHAT